MAAGAIAEKYLAEAYGVEIVAFVESVGRVSLPWDRDSGDDVLSPEYVKLLDSVNRVDIDKEITRCPHPETSKKIEEAIRAAKANNDSMGGVITCVVRNVPPGLGEPVFDKLEAVLAHAMLSGFDGLMWTLIPRHPIYESF